MHFQYQVDPPKWLGRLVMGLMAFSYVAALAGDLLLSNFVDQHPLALVLLGPSDRNLALAVNEIEPLSYYTLGLLRHLSTDPLMYLLGFWYGDNAIAWVGRRSRSFGSQANEMIPEFRKWSWLAVFVFPFNIVCLLAGAAGLRFRTFILVNIAGTLTRLFLISRFASYFDGPISGLTGFIAENRLAVFGVSLVFVGVTIYREFWGSHAKPHHSDADPDDSAESDSDVSEADVSEAAD